VASNFHKLRSLPWHLFGSSARCARRMYGDCAAGIYRSSDALASHASYGHDAAVVVTKLGRFYIATAWSVCLECVSAGSSAAEAHSAFCRGETQSSGL
jgi:hypothetical protein